MLIIANPELPFSLIVKANFRSGLEEPTIFGQNKDGYTATLVVCGWAGAVLEKVTRASGQEP